MILGPNITGGFWDLITTIKTPTMGTADGVFFTNYLSKDNRVYSTYEENFPYYGEQDGIGFNAHLASSVYRNTPTVQPKTLIFNYIIKY